MSLTIKHRVSLDLSLTSVQATIPFRKGDKGAHEVIFSLRNGTTNVELPPGTVATIAVLNGADDGKGVNDMCTVDHINHRIIYIPTVAALSVAGNVACELTVVGTNGEVLGAPRIHFFVDESMTDVTEKEIAEALKASGSWDVIQKTATNAKDAAQSKEDARKWADGMYATSDDPQYQNNAKYYAKLAGDHAKNAAAAAQGAANAKADAKKAQEAAEHASSDADGARESAHEHLLGAQEAEKNARQHAEQIGKGAAFLRADLDHDFILSFKLVDAAGREMSEASVDLPLESLITKIKYDKTSKDLIFTLSNGETMEVPLDDIFEELATEEKLKAGLDGKVDKLPVALKLQLYGTDSNGDPTSYSIAGTTGNSALAIMTQAAVTAALKELSTSIKTNEDNIAKNAEDIAVNTERIDTLEQNGGGELNNLYDAEIPVGDIIDGIMIMPEGGYANQAQSCATDFISVNGGGTVRIERCYLQYSRSICAYDREKKFVECVATASNDTEITYKIPREVRYIRVTGVSGVPPKITKINYPINSDLDALRTSIDEVQGATLQKVNDSFGRIGIGSLGVGELTDGYIYAPTGTIASVGDSSGTDFIAVNFGAKLEINGAYLEGNRSICGYNENKKHVATLVFNTTNSAHVLTVPPGVKYIRITCRRNVAPTVFQLSTPTQNDIYIPDIVIEGDFEAGYLLADGKGVHADDRYRISPYIAVHPHQEIEVRNFWALGAYSLHCYDADKNTVKSFVATPNAIKREVFALPFNAHFVRVHTVAGAEGDIAIYYTKQKHHDAGTIELVNEWFDGAHGKIDKLFRNATKKPIITFIDDDTTSVEGVKRFRDICMELGICGTYACITSMLDGNNTLKETLLEYQNEGFHIAMHAHSEHNLYVGVDLNLNDGIEPTEEELKRLERDFVTCISRLKSFGFIDTDFWITPGGSIDYVNDDLMRKWGINCYITCGNDGLEYEGTNPKRGRYGLVRPSIGYDDEHGSQTLAQILTIIDNASTDNGWVIVCTHMGQSEWSNETALDRFRELVNYAREKGFEVRTLNDAWRIREPIYKLYEMF